MDIRDLQNKNVTDLHKLLAETREVLRELRFKSSERQLNTVHKIKLARKDIARILTELNARRIKAQVN